MVFAHVLKQGGSFPSGVVLAQIEQDSPPAEGQARKRRDAVLDGLRQFLGIKPGEQQASGRREFGLQLCHLGRGGFDAELLLALLGFEEF